MDWISFITTMFSLGCDVTGYVGLVITPEQYKQITGKDYVAPVAKPQA
ncbi:XkdX family protein [Limosilactobacillus fermentum]|uniref:XkdX family protein n=2 Tax=Limosilactobacillus fermentum TaxID=1613 RepID=A0A1L7GTX4_LIMFE|nr:XkdX family protein [Limosilactobacillus fermentum]AKM51598.1 XkdX family protein [Limosilactobacillus fermentum 3872]APU45384.1 XkdX family protein [Limosilactobacillus fermentum]MCJ2388707.1 XkdX family protein [Limosilactobacillus fermentum]MCS8619088.1 XkdX family protein [Limosilactobacillus fermentum]MCT3438459.1 XkdX family protein [Limosilactobacillus fermentum]